MEDKRHYTTHVANTKRSKWRISNKFTFAIFEHKLAMKKIYQ